MSCGGPEKGTPALYCCGNASLPCHVLYTSGELAFCQFRTRQWTRHQGYQNFVVAPIFREHLKFCEECPENEIQPRLPIARNTTTVSAESG